MTIPGDVDTLDVMLHAIAITAAGSVVVGITMGTVLLAASVWEYVVDAINRIRKAKLR